MGAPVSPQLLTSIVIVSSSTYLYNIHPPPKPVAAKGMVVLAEMVQPDLDELEQAPTRKSNGSANGKANGKAVIWRTMAMSVSEDVLRVCLKCMLSNVQSPKSHSVKMHTNGRTLKDSSDHRRMKFRGRYIF